MLAEGKKDFVREGRKGTSPTRIIIVLLVLNLLLSGGIITYLAISSVNDSAQTETLSGYESEANGKYVLYIGTNDKDTYKQEISSEDAKKTVNEICSRYVDGYTVQEASGGWVDEKGKLTQEATLIYSFNNARQQDINSIMDEVLEALNQNSIMVERQDLTYTYYNGK